MIVLAVLLFVGVSLLLWAGLALIRRYDRRYREYTAAANDFYVAADQLVDNRETPEDVLSLIDSLNETINFPHTAVVYTRILQRQGRERQNRSFDIYSIPQSVVADFVTAMNAWVDAVSYRGLFFGSVLRIYLDARSIQSTATKVAGQVNSGGLVHA